MRVLDLPPCEEYINPTARCLMRLDENTQAIYCVDCREAERIAITQGKELTLHQQIVMVTSEYLNELT